MDWETNTLCTEGPHHCWWKLDGLVLFSLSVTMREGLLWAFQAFAGKRRGGGKVSLPSTWITLSPKEELLHVAQGRSFTQLSLAVAPSEADAGLKPRVMRLSLFSFLCTALRATAWNSKDSLEVGWACEGGTWGLMPGFWHALAHLLHRSARRALQGTMRRIRLNETLGSFTGGENQGCRDNQLWLSQQYLEVSTGVSGEAVSGRSVKVYTSYLLFDSST